MRDRMIGGGLMTLALVALIGCSSSSGSSSAPASAAPESAAAPSAAAPSEAASQAAPSEAAASEPAASLAIPGYTFPSEAKDLEALIPDTFCGAKAQKLSLQGKDVFNANNTSAAGIEAALNSIGKTTADVSAAAGIPLAANSDCSVIIFRINGADEGQMKTLVEAEAQKQNQTFTVTSLGGKTVYRTDPSKFEYAYIKGDGVIIFSAGSQKDAEDLVAKLP
jgi:hypothetical protein